MPTAAQRRGTERALLPRNGTLCFLADLAHHVVHVQPVLTIAMINIPLRVPNTDDWITVPPQGYGGVQWVVANLVDGLLELGHTVYLLGAPGSPSTNPRLRIVDAGEAADIREWLRTAAVDIVHDHANGIVPLSEGSTPFVSTHHLTGAPRVRQNAIYLSYAQRADACGGDAPVIRIPVNPSRYDVVTAKGDFLLTVSRISRWKGVLEAARFASVAGMRLYVAGPAWEADYVQEIVSCFSHAVQFIGEIGGDRRLQMLAAARAVLVLSQPCPGPWGGVWCEPGATIVSESAASGTPVIASNNGCLPEIAPHVGVVIGTGQDPSPHVVERALAELPSAETVRTAAIREWGHVKIAAEHVSLYRQCIAGARWN